MELDWKATAAAREKDSGEPAAEHKIPPVVRKVIDEEAPENWFSFEEAELKDMLSAIKDAIGFWGYKKSNALKNR